ncbi:tRNA pseudouridine(38-40) synthase TruA [Rosistilla oblonga]|uniref:tRNA pseudouridine(38-40) synthase TruA n=1 Tax=Rosistilla oblonga TaxID=2527990 RepID=UPI003A9717CC
MLRTFRLTIGYDGFRYAGWQVQADLPTIQGELQRAFAELTGERVSITGSGRTDSGVHAIAQVASLTTDAWRSSDAALGRAINTKIPDDITVYRCEEMPVDFHALRDAVGKRYRYQLQIGGVRDAFDFRYFWHHHVQLDIEAMRQAAAMIVGTHDFACFQATGSERKTTVRTIHDLALTTGQGRAGQGHLIVEVEANGFLYNMVRNIVGSLVEVGRGKHPPTWIEELIAGRDRNQAGPTAPAHALFLLRVDYDVQPLAAQQ